MRVRVLVRDDGVRVRVRVRVMDRVRASKVRGQTGRVRKVRG